MDEDGLPTLFLDTRPDFRFQFHLRCYEKKKKNTELEKTVLWNLSKLLSLFDTVRYEFEVLESFLDSAVLSIFYYSVRLIKRIRFRRWAVDGQCEN